MNSYHEFIALWIHSQRSMNSIYEMKNHEFMVWFNHWISSYHQFIAYQESRWLCPSATVTVTWRSRGTHVTPGESDSDTWLETVTSLRGHGRLRVRLSLSPVATVLIMIMMLQHCRSISRPLPSGRLPHGTIYHPKMVYTTLGIYHGIYKIGRWYTSWYIP